MSKQNAKETFPIRYIQTLNHLYISSHANTAGKYSEQATVQSLTFMVLFCIRVFISILSANIPKVSPEGQLFEILNLHFQRNEAG